MNNLEKTVLLTGAGGAVIPFLIRRLQAKSYRVIVTDINPNSNGFYIADKGYIVPSGNSDDFFLNILNICEKEKVDAIIPCVDEELLKCIELEKYGIKVILPKLDFIKLCLDKYSLMNSLANNNITVPKTCLASEFIDNWDFPLIIKPRTGRGSRGLAIIKTKQELSKYLENTDYEINDLIIQEFIIGTEFTVSVVVWRDGKVQAVVPKEIISKVGITRQAVTRRNIKIDKVCRKIQETLKANGPFNVQLMLDKNSGEPFIFEINPRFSTSISLTIVAGVDEMIELVQQALFNTSSKNFDNWEEGIVLLRQTCDDFMMEQEYTNKKLSIEGNLK